MDIEARLEFLLMIVMNIWIDTSLYPSMEFPHVCVGFILSNQVCFPLLQYHLEVSGSYIPLCLI